MYASFIAGYDDSLEDIRAAVRLLIEEKVLLAGFSPVTPYPGTPLYDRLRNSGRLPDNTWWLSNPYPYWEFVFNKEAGGGYDDLKRDLDSIRESFYSWTSIFKRLNKGRALISPVYLIRHLLLNRSARKEIKEKKKITEE